MGFLKWVGNNWFIFLQSVGILGGLIFTGFSVRADVKARRASNLLIITQQHREIWTQLYSRPELARVLSPAVDLTAQPVTLQEDLFVSLLVLHLNSSYYAMREGVFKSPEHLRADIQEFFSLPIPKAVWQKLKPLQDGKFVQFVDASLSSSA